MSQFKPKQLNQPGIKLNLSLQNYESLKKFEIFWAVNSILNLTIRLKGKIDYDSTLQQMNARLQPPIFVTNFNEGPTHVQFCFH